MLRQTSSLRNREMLEVLTLFPKTPYFNQVMKPVGKCYIHSHDSSLFSS